MGCYVLSDFISQINLLLKNNVSLCRTLLRLFYFTSISLRFHCIFMALGNKLLLLKYIFFLRSFFLFFPQFGLIFLFISC